MTPRIECLLVRSPRRRTSPDPETTPMNDTALTLPRRGTSGRPIDGFTLVELIVVIAIIGVMIALTLPAIQAAREAARRLSCGNNLGQLAIGVHQYELTWRHFPTGSLDRGTTLGEAPAGMHHGWIAQLLPYLDQQPRYAKIDFSRSVYDPANRPMARLGMSLLACPSAEFLGNRGGSNYAACHHDSIAPIAEANDGAFVLNRRLTLDDFSDGFGTTIFLGEKLDGHVGSWIEGTDATLRAIGSPLVLSRTRWSARVAYDELLAYERRLIDRPEPETPAEAPAEEGSGDGIVIVPETNDRSLESIRDRIMAREGRIAPLPGNPPDVETMSLEESEEESDETLDDADAQAAAAEAEQLARTQRHGFSSGHPAGGMFAFGDGSVRMLTNELDPSVARRLGNRRDGEPIDERIFP